MDTGDLETGYLQSGGRLKITDSSSTEHCFRCIKSFGQLVTLDTSGTGTTFTDGTFTRCSNYSNRNWKRNWWYC